MKTLCIHCSVVNLHRAPKSPGVFCWPGEAIWARRAPISQEEAASLTPCGHLITHQQLEELPSSVSHSSGCDSADEEEEEEEEEEERTRGLMLRCRTATSGNVLLGAQLVVQSEFT
ncbi:unnamed protein product [Pleuronectes platessa]|uniref:Uncharacterized protein n=1 Tax=Pleuronectes platessa TaxID=8262 RepID=A0A9N7YCR8_PLEPL|nr:unnamed protein product [Pleuronectes platessa]